MNATKKRVKEAANKAAQIAKTYTDSNDPQAAAEHGLAIATKGQPASFKNAVRAELRVRGYRI